MLLLLCISVQLTAVTLGNVGLLDTGLLPAGRFPQTPPNSRGFGHTLLLIGMIEKCYRPRNLAAGFLRPQQPEAVAGRGLWGSLGALPPPFSWEMFTFQTLCYLPKAFSRRCIFYIAEPGPGLAGGQEGGGGASGGGGSSRVTFALQTVCCRYSRL